MNSGVDWNQKEFERAELNPAAAKLLARIGIRGEAISKLLISGAMGSELQAVDKGILMNSLTSDPKSQKDAVRIGTNVRYAPFVFLGTSKMGARPVLRTMLVQLKTEMRSWT